MTKQEMYKEVTLEVHRLRNELVEHGFNVYPIRSVKLSTRCIKRFGLCTYHTNRHGDIAEVTITISDICFHSTENCLRDVILHELCHAMPNGQGHRAGFHSNARKVMQLYDNCHIGSTATYEESKKKNEYLKSIGAYKYKVTCNGCGHSYYYKKETRLIKLLKAHKSTDTWHCGECKHNEFKLEVLQ